MRRTPRKFYLSSASGVRYGLNGEHGAWLTDPSGLGLELSPSFANARNGFFAVTVVDDVPQGALYGTLVFTGAEPYANYQSLLSWALAAGDGLLVVYEPMPGKEYYRQAALTSLTKGEIEAPGWLRCEMTLQAMTPWYRPSQLRRDLTPNTGNIMLYKYRYSPGLRYPADNRGQMRATITAVGHLASALTLECDGPVVTPTLRLVGLASGKDYGRLSLDADFKEGERLRYSSRYLNAYVQKIDATGDETDLLPLVDLAYEPWLRVPVSEPCTFILSAASAIPGGATVKVYDYYWSV